MIIQAATNEQHSLRSGSLVADSVSKTLHIQAAKVVAAHAASVGDNLLGVPLLCSAGQGELYISLHVLVHTLRAACRIKSCFCLPLLLCEILQSFMHVWGWCLLSECSVCSIMNL